MSIKTSFHSLLFVGSLILSLALKSAWWVTVFGPVAVLFLTTALDSDIRTSLRSWLNRMAVRYVLNPRYVYDLLVRSKIHQPLTPGEVEKMVTDYFKSNGVSILSNTLLGTNYYQFSISTPPEAIQIRWHEAINDLEDLENTDFEPTSYDLYVSLDSPHVAKLNDLEDRRMETLISLLAGISSYITSRVGQQNSKILITVNRLEGNVQPKALTPPNGALAKREESNGAVVLRDDHSLQIFANSPASVMQLMTKGLDTLQPA